MSYIRILGVLLALVAGLVACRPDAAMISSAATAATSKKTSNVASASALESVREEVASVSQDVASVSGSVDSTGEDVERFGRRLGETNERLDDFIKLYEEQQERDYAFTRQLVKDLERVKREKEEVEASYEAFLEKVVGDGASDTSRPLRPVRRTR